MTTQFTIQSTDEFNEWFDGLSNSHKGAVKSRVERIELEGHFGTVKNLGDGVSELKWANGLRVYFSRVAKTDLLLLLGGTKNGQDRDIKKAKKLLNR